MIYWLFQDYFERGGLVVRIALTGITSFAVVMFLGPWMIRFLLRKKLGDRPEFDHVDLNELTRHKSNTPTMGGILIVIAILVSVLLFGNLDNSYVRMGMFALIWLGGLGAVDDWIKLRHSAGRTTRDGLKMWEKIVFQVGLAVLLSVFIRQYGSQSFVIERTGQVVNPPHCLYLPFKTAPIYLPMAAYVLLTVVTMVGSSNAVNLTDGMDGLASGCLVIVTGVFLLLSWVVGVENWAQFFNMPFVDGTAGMTVLCAAMLGACLGFLWYNAHPAQVFMGDTGSLPLGGLLGYIAVVTRQEVLLVIAGGVFVMEAGSVILQIGYYKLTKGGPSMVGRRLFRCAPIHHHFHLGGWAETKVVVRFWLLCLLFAALALATLKLR